MSLNGKQRRALRALGHHLDPVIQVGKDGVTEALVQATAQALEDHELIKVKVGDSSPQDRHEAAEALEQGTGGEVAQVLGRTILLFKRREKEPEIALPGLPLPPKPAKAPEPASPPRKRSAKARPTPRRR